MGERRSGFCINCDNKHGCKSENPPCIADMTEKGVTGLSGKDYLLSAGKTGKCKECPFFRSCWKRADYDSLTKQGEHL